MNKIIFILLLGITGHTLSAQINDKLKSNSTEDFHVVEQGAKPKGGYGKLFNYFSKKAKFPKNYDYPNDKGEVYVQFVILESGKVDKNSVQLPDPSKFEGRPGLLHDEYFTNLAIELVKNMSPWIPAEYEGQKVKQTIILPVTFKK